MEVRTIERVIRALNEARVRYLVVGGLAVLAHGYVRFTADMDLVIDLRAENLHKALAVFHDLGYRPLAPVALEEFADPDIRQQWIDEKQMRVFTIFSSIDRDANLDLLVQSPFADDAAFDRSVAFEIAPGIAAPVVGLEDLIRMKAAAARPKDLLDLEYLHKLKEMAGDDAPS
jgi:hypothetical protein